MENRAFLVVEPEREAVAAPFITRQSIARVKGTWQMLAPGLLAIWQEMMAILQLRLHLCFMSPEIVGGQMQAIK